MPQITQLGFIMIPLCLWYWDRADKLLSIALFSTAFGAASVINFNFGGFGVPIIPPYFPGLVFIAMTTLRYLAGQRWGSERSVARVYLPFILFGLYCVADTIFMPNIMAGRLLVWPQRGGVFNVRVPLYFNTGNISQLSYVIFTVVFCFQATCYVARKPWIAERLLFATFVSGYVVIFFGIWQFISRVSGLYFPTDLLFSNTFIALNSEQTVGANTIRVSGSFSEPAALAGHVCGTVYATFWLILKGDKRGFVLWLFVLSIGLVVISTSTTGYIVLAVGLPGMMILSAASAKSDALLRLLKVVLLGSIAVTAVIVIVPWMSPQVGDRAIEVIQLTLQKEDTQSFEERSTWDADALSLIMPTLGFGVGWGSLRSSSLGPAILGGTGVWGFGLFVWFVCRVAFAVRRTRRRLASYAAQMRVVEALSASLVAFLLGLLLAGPNFTVMEAWIPVSAVLGIAVRTSQIRFPISKFANVRSRASIDAF